MRHRFRPARLIAFATAIEPLRSANRMLGFEAYRWRLASADGKPVPIRLSAGEHTLFSICVANRLNMDYFALVPVAGQ